MYGLSVNKYFGVLGVKTGVNNLINNDKPKSPCMGCDKRYVGCHSKCEDYIAFKKLSDDMNAETRKRKDLDGVYSSYRKDSAKRFYKKRKVITGKK